MRKQLKRLGAVGLLVLGFGLAYYFDLAAYFSLDGLRENEARLRDFAANSPFLAVTLYILTYAIAVALSLPGAIWLTLSGGLIFGTIWGGALAVTGASIGASLLFLLARYVIGDFFRDRYGARLQGFEAGFNENAASYLLSMRLVPIFPFFLVNLGAAFMAVPLRTFFWTTFIGIIPGGFVYASIGNGIGFLLQNGKEPELSLFGRPEILVPLVGLGVLSLVPVFLRRFKSAD